MDKSDFLAFTCLGTLPQAYEHLDDSVVHQSCLSGWEQRDDFVKHWNMAVRYSSLAPETHLLRVENGRVEYRRK
ncbi:MAG: hypothetical protein FJ224_13255 [Lentisphaerae bacterium]|nr:hypothetical protein [Lentisphaerota bacterium]